MLTATQTVLWRHWIKALKSGAFRQGQRVLHGGWDTYCCLGVAQYLLGQECGLAVGGVNELTKTLYGFEHSTGFNFSPDRSIACLNDHIISVARDYSNVLPAIEAYFEEHRYRSGG